MGIIVAIVLGVVAILGGFSLDTFTSNIETISGQIENPKIQKNVDQSSCQVWIYEPETDNKYFIDEYDEDCLEFIKLPLTEQYAIYEKEKPTDNYIKSLCEDAWQTYSNSINIDVYDFLKNHSSCMDYYCPPDMDMCKYETAKRNLAFHGIVDGTKEMDRAKEGCQYLFSLAKTPEGIENYHRQSGCWYFMDEIG